MLIKLLKWLNDRLTKVEKKWVLQLPLLTFSSVRIDILLNLQLSQKTAICSVLALSTLHSCDCFRSVWPYFLFYFFSWTMHLLTWANVWSCLLQHYAFHGCHSPHRSPPYDHLQQGFSTLGLLFWTNSLGGGYHLGIVESSAASLVSTHSVLLAPSPCLITKMSPEGKMASVESH